MRFVNTFDPSLTSSGTIPVGISDSGQKVLMYNESPVTIQINFEDGSTTFLHAWEANYWTLDHPTYQLEWTLVRTLTGSGQAPASFVDVFIYDAYEKVEGTYPVQLNRLTNLGNQSSTGTVTSIINDNQASGTSIVESTQTNSTGSNVTMDNNGNMALKQYVSSTLLTLFQTIAGVANGSSNVKLSDANHQCEVLGNLLCDLALTVNGNAVVGGNLNVTGTITGGSIAGADHIINDGNAAATSVVEAKQVNSTGSNVSITNDGNMTLKQYVSSTLLTIFQTIAGATNTTSNVKLSDANHQCEVLGNLLCDLALTVTGTSTFTGDATFNGSGNGITVTNNALISGNETVTGTLTVTGDSTFNGTGNGITVTNNSLISGNEAITGTLTVTGDVSLNGAGTGLTVAHNALISGNETVTGTLTVNGAATGLTVANNALISGNETVTGNSSLDNGNITTDGSGNLTFVGNTKSISMHDNAGNLIQVIAFDGTTAQQLNILNAVFNNKLLKVFSNVNLQNALTVTGTSTFTGDATFNGSGNGITVTNNALISGNETVTGTSTFTGDATFNGSGNGITVTNNALISGNEAVTGTLVVTGDATFNGSGNGITVTNNSLISGNETVTGSVTVNGAGTALSVTNNANVGGTLSATGNIICNAPASGSSQFQAINNSGVVKDILYINTGGNTIVQCGGSGKIFFRDSASANLASIDSSGNLRLKGALTQNTTP